MLCFLGMAKAGEKYTLDYSGHSSSSFFCLRSN